MVVRIRLARFGNKHQHFTTLLLRRHGQYVQRKEAALKLILCEHYRSARNSKPLEVIGTYNPVPQRPTNLSDEEARSARPYKEVSLDRSRAKYWIGVGAQPSDGVWRLLSLAGIGDGRTKTQN
ncbi:mitochondrial 37S ribosomal protein MRPS16 [Aspergillus bombycis]|uniref:Mitochondrial 37S ribosomal protein MRPS16 n=1 Tax=Aspergillus bombycis TaxID=109264 RepID=A0A1F7ZK27_9EURO|nr:mitochondrial 37S ribosomal protein MRPS16 [Aspergillus bombycis]OGM39659.1 mitochondrial 37S ribosomal protein MRPS16 [Aspergillus bombycis]